MISARLTNCFVSNSQHGAAFLRAQLKVPKERIKIIPNGVQLNPPIHTPQQWRDHIGINSNHLVVSMVANFNAKKDHLTLLKAWKRILTSPKDNKTPILILAGPDQGTINDVKALAFDLNLGKTVRFIGQVEDIAGLLEIVDISVFSSVREGLPNSVLEAMLAHKPIVATDIPGVKEALGDAYPYLSPQGDEISLSDNLLKFMQDSDLRVKVGEKNKIRAEKMFSLEKMCAQTVSYIKSSYP